MKLTKLKSCTIAGATFTASRGSDELLYLTMESGNGADCVVAEAPTGFVILATSRGIKPAMLNALKRGVFINATPWREFLVRPDAVQTAGAEPATESTPEPAQTPSPLPLQDVLDAYVANLEKANVYSSRINVAELHNIVVDELSHILSTHRLPPEWVGGKRPQY